MRHPHKEGDWLENTFIWTEIFRHLFSLKGLLFIVVVMLLISTWNPFGRGNEQLSGEITDQLTHLPVDSAFVSLQDTSGNILQTTMSDESGVFAFEVVEFLSYRIQIEKEGYHSRVVKDTREMNNSSSVVLRFHLQPE